MNKSPRSTSRRVSSLLRAATAMCLGMTCGSQLAMAQDYVEAPYTETSWPSWRSRWNGKFGAISYGPALTHCSRIHQKNLPVYPPLYGPGFGYHQTCWRQISAETLCGPCENLRGPSDTFRNPSEVFQGHEETTLLPGSPTAASSPNGAIIRPASANSNLGGTEKHLHSPVEDSITLPPRF